MGRRRFLATAGLGLTALSGALGRTKGGPRLCILHTNDTHSRLDPFPMDGGRMQGLGGVARRKVLIDRIRQQEEHVLLVDSGDIFQGTPYYNLFQGEPELKAMNLLGYDVSAIGNHEFDSGMEALARGMRLARFEWVCANLDFAGSVAAGLSKPWVVKQVGPFRVGLFGLLCRLEGMVNPMQSQGVVYLDPVESARASVAALRAEGCDLVVCLSHLGYRARGEGDELRDESLVAAVEGIDLVLGGHSHTFIDELVSLPRMGGGMTRISQQGWGGVRVGRVDVGLRGRELAWGYREMWVG